MASFIDYKTDIEPNLNGLWVDVLAQYGIEVGAFKGRNTKNGPCALCGGDDRAHWRETSGRVSLSCRHCAADKMKSPEGVIMEYCGIDFAQFCSDMIGYLNLTPIEKRKSVKKVSKSISYNTPSCHKQDPEQAARFVAKFGKRGIFIDRCGEAFLPVYNHLNQLINIAKVMTNGYRFQAGGISYGGFAIVPGNDRVILCVDHRDALRINNETGATVLITFYILNLNFCVGKIDEFKSCEVELRESEKEYFNGFNEIIDIK